MGLFDKFSKKNESEAEETLTEKNADTAEAPAEETEAPAQEKTEENTEEAPAKKGIPISVAPTMEQPKGTTRFTLMVENVFTVDEGVSVAAVGNLHGKIKAGDSFYIIHPMFPQGIKATADTLVVGDETPESAENCRVAIKMTDVKKPTAIPKYSVISNIEPQLKADPRKPLENPFLVGLTAEYNRLVKERDFTYIFMVALLSSRYITPAEMEIEAPDAQGQTTVKNSKISFKLLRHPNDEKLNVLPVFTDTMALRMWKGAFDGTPEGEKPKTLMMPFERAAEIGTRNGGIVVNPFGPFPVFVANQNIENTLKLGREAMERQKTLDALGGKK